MFEISPFFHKGKCEKITQDLVERFWSFLTTLDSNTVAQFMKDNLAGTVVVFSLLIWIPASCYVNRIVSGLNICRNIIIVVVPRNDGNTDVYIPLQFGKNNNTFIFVRYR